MGCPAKRWIGREGNGAEGCLWLNKIMGFFCVCCASNSGETKEWFGQNEGMVWAKRRNGLVFCVWVSVWFLAKILGLLWLIFPRGLGLLYGLLPTGLNLHRAWVAVKLRR